MNSKNKRQICENNIRKELLLPWAYFGFLRSSDEWQFANDKEELKGFHVIDIRGLDSEEAMAKIKQKFISPEEEKNTHCDLLSKLFEENKNLKEIIARQTDELCAYSKYKMSYEKVLSINKDQEKTINNFISVIGSLSEHIKSLKFENRPE